MGRVMMSGIVPTLKAPVTGILASSLAVGTTVKLMEGGTAVEYLVVNQGIPSNSNLYDASCDGTWLLRKDLHSKRAWNTTNLNTYASSSINTWLNGDFFNSLGSTEKSAVKQIKIPYCVGNNTSTIKSGANGLPVKLFLLGGYEVGLTAKVTSNLYQDSAKLSYFSDVWDSAGLKLRIAYLNGVASLWATRTPTASTMGIKVINADGGAGELSANNESNSCIRPALILPGNAVFDETTMLLKGVK